MSQSLRIAILECDTPIDPIKTKYGPYGDIFESHLKEGLGRINANASLQLTKINVVQPFVDYPKPEDFDAVLLTGSKYDSYKDEPWILTLTRFVQDCYLIHHKPVIGICFGHQIIARALGARVGPNVLGWEVAVESVDLTSAGKRLLGRDTLAIHMMHRDIVYEVPPGCVNLGATLICGIQGLYVPKRILCVQGHPEYNEFMVSELLKLRRGMLGEALYENAMARVGREHDGLVFAETMCRFALGILE